MHSAQFSKPDRSVMVSGSKKWTLTLRQACAKLVPSLRQLLRSQSPQEARETLLCNERTNGPSRERLSLAPHPGSELAPPCATLRGKPGLEKDILTSAEK